MKKGKIGGGEPDNLARLDPLLPLLVRALKSRHAGVTSLSLRAFSLLVHLPLPGTALLNILMHSMGLAQATVCRNGRVLICYGEKTCTAMCHPKVG